MNRIVSVLTDEPGHAVDVARRAYMMSYFEDVEAFGPKRPRLVK